MTLEELVNECERVRYAGRELVQFVVPCKTGRHARVRLFGKMGGPLSEEIACVTERGTVAWWSVNKVLAWLETNAYLLPEAAHQRMKRCAARRIQLAAPRGRRHTEGA